MNTDRLLDEFKHCYGSSEGLRIYLTVMPGILADFNKMLAKAPAGQRIREEYRMEDGSSTLILEGTRKGNGNQDLEARLHTASR